MLVGFRQGLVRAQAAPNFLIFNNGAVNLDANNEPTVIAFAYGEYDYLFTESESITSAWTGPFLPNKDYWLYWDINKLTGIRSFGHTDIDPFNPNGGFGTATPPNPIKGQHFFNTSTNKMLVWSGNSWQEKIRVFAGHLRGKNIVPLKEGSQINLNQERRIGHILFDSAGDPITRVKDDSFLTSESVLTTQDTPLIEYKLESEQIRARGVEPIAKFHGVTWTSPSRIGLASNLEPSKPCVGVAVEDINKNETRKFATKGYLYNEFWNFKVKAGSPLWIGETGKIVDQMPNSTSVQQIGIVVDSNTMFVDIKPPYKLNAPAPTPTITPSVTVTPTISVTPTVTPTISITPTNTPTPTVTPTVTPTNTVTPTITPNVTPTNTVTPTVTPSVTVTVTPTVTPAVTPTNTVTPTLTPTVTPTVTPTPTTPPPQISDGYTSGGVGGFESGERIDGFPFSNPFTTATDVGNLSQDTRYASGQSSSEDGYTSGGSTVISNTNVDTTKINSFPFSSPFTTATDVGDISETKRWPAGQSSSEDGYASSGRFITSIDSFPFSSPFTTATVVGNLTQGRYGLAGQSSSEDGYTSGGDPGDVATIDSFPFSSPFTTAAIVGNLSQGRGYTTGQSSSEDGYTSGGAFPIVALIDSFPFSSPFTTATDIGDLSIARRSPIGQSGTEDGAASGGTGPNGDYFTIDQFPFSSPFTTATDVGDLTVIRYAGAGQQG